MSLLLITKKAADNLKLSRLQEQQIVIMGASSKYLVIYHAISAGQNGPNLGCDEEEIVMILYLVLNVAENKVSTCQPLVLVYLLVWRRTNSYSRKHSNTSEVLSQCQCPGDVSWSPLKTPSNSGDLR